MPKKNDRPTVTRNITKRYGSYWIRFKNSSGESINRPTYTNDIEEAQRILKEHQEADTHHNSSCTICGEKSVFRFKKILFCQKHYSDLKKYINKVESVGVVYFAQSVEDGMIKIGMTKNLRQRINILSHDYGKVKLLATMPGGKDVESDIHAKFLGDRSSASNEWFYPSPELAFHIFKQIDKLSEEQLAEIQVINNSIERIFGDDEVNKAA